MASMAERTDPHGGEPTTGPHDAADDHGEDHGHDDRAHGVEALGPVDVKLWGAALIGIALGLVIVVAFIQAAS
jgi:hypothetical protein